MLRLPSDFPKGALIDPSLVEAELAEPNWKVDMVDSHPAVDFVI